MTDDLIAPRVDSTTWYSGVGIAESFDGLRQGVESGNWIDIGIGGVATGLEALNWVVNPFESVLAAGLGALLEHVGPLSDALEWLAGDPDQIRAYAETWRNVAREQAGLAEELLTAVRTQIPDWSGSAGSTYTSHAQRTSDLLDALSRGALTMGTVVETSALLVALVREMVRDLLAEFVAALIVLAAEELFSLGFATPLVVAQATTLAAKWGGKIARLLRRLISSLRNLVPVVRQLDTGMGTILVLMRRQEPDIPGGGGGTPTGSSGWNDPWVQSSPWPPPRADQINVPPGRRIHILDGDGLGNGGHAPGTGIPGKTEFPESWDDDKIIDEILDVARNPDSIPPPTRQDHGTWMVTGTRDGVKVTVIIGDGGEVISGFPESGPGVVRNPS